MPVAQPLLMVFFALSPIVWLVVGLCVLKLEAYQASLGALAIAAACALLAWQMPVLHMGTAALEGFAMALWPIIIVIVAAVFTYNLAVHSGAMDDIKRMLCSVSADRRVLALLICWCFGDFLEGMAGFGTAIAIPASMLAALGVDPVVSILACLITNGFPTMFGSIGTATVTLAAVTGLDSGQLAFTQSLMTFPFLVVCPFLIVMLVGGGPKALRGMVPFALVAGVSFAAPQLATAYFAGAELTDVVGSVCSLAATFSLAYATRKRPVSTEQLLDVPKAGGAFSPAAALRAWSPFILIFAVLMLTSKLVPAVNVPLSQFRSTVNIYAGDPNATLSFMWINTPGVLIFFCAIAGGLIQGCTLRQIASVFARTCVQMSKTVATMLCVLACAKIMGYSGMIATIASFFVGTLGSAYPLAAPLLGALGTFVTGSGTSSGVLFGDLQVQAAAQIGVDPLWLAASNSLGTSAGKMLAPQSIAIGCAACEADGREGETMARIAPYAFAFALLASVLTYAFA